MVTFRVCQSATLKPTLGLEASPVAFCPPIVGFPDSPCSHDVVGPIATCSGSTGASAFSDKPQLDR